MKADLTIKNYRCFGDTEPLRFTLSNGYTGFVGRNNSGKTSILKFFHELRECWSILGSSGELVSVLQGKPRGLQVIGVLDQSEIFSNFTSRDLEIEIVFSADHIPNTTPLSVSRVKIIISRGRHYFTVNLWTAEKIISLSNKVQLKGMVLSESTMSPVADLTAFCEFFRSLAEVMYIGPFRNAINIGKGEYFDVKVGTAFIETWHQWQTGTVKRLNEFIQSVVRDIEHIFRYRDLQIMAARESNTLQIYANGKSYKLHELGGGIAQFVVVLGNAATRQPSLILIDEPELNLHPSLQLDFLTSLTSYSKFGTLFATHSLGLARSAADRVYSVQTVDEKANVKPFEQTANLAEFLGELNFSGFREVGFNKVLLVEGVTDVRTIQQFLRLIRKDHHVVPLQLGGSQMITGSREVELAEVVRITSDVFALVDSEREYEGAPLSPERQAFCDTCSNLGIKVLALKRRAIENYFTENAIQNVKGSSYRTLGAFEKLKDAQPAWGKQENWRIARAMRFKDIQDTDLGEFLVNL